MSAIVPPQLPVISSRVTPTEVKKALDTIQRFFALVGKSGGLPTRDELVSTGVAAYSQSGTLQPSDGAVYGIPPAPTGLVAVGAFATIQLAWNVASYRGHAYTEIFRAEVDDIGQVVLIARELGWTYADDPPQASVSKTYYYWIRFVNKNGVAGPFNGIAGTAGSTANDPAYILEIIQNQIQESHLYGLLRDRLNLIDTPGTGLIDVTDALQQATATLNQALADTQQAITDTTNRLDGDLAAAEKGLSDRLERARVDAAAATDLASEGILQGLLNAYDAYQRVNGVKIDWTTFRDAIADIDTGTGTITLKAVDALRGETESSLSQVSIDLDAVRSSITLKADKTTVGAQGTRITSAEQWIDGATATISQHTQDIVTHGGRLDDAESAITQHAGDISLRATTVYVNQIASDIISGLTPYKTWEFPSTTESWVGTNATVSASSSILTLTGTAANPSADLTTGLTIDGSQFTQVIVNLKRTGGTGWVGRIYYATDGHPAYSSSSTYAVGAVVTYSGSVYVCSTAITTPEAWNAAHWTQKGPAHGFSAYYYKVIQAPVNDGSYRSVAASMRTLDAGGTDWADTIISGIRLALGAGSGDNFAIDWIQVARSSVEQLLFNDIEARMAQAEADIDGNTGQIALRATVAELHGLTAPAYSDAATYAVGDRVVYDSAMWECSTAITAPESWTQAHWTQLSGLGAELKQAEVDIDAAKADILLRATKADFEGTVAPLFNTQGTYTVGDQVVYDSWLWECHAAVTNAGEWTGAANWTQQSGKLSTRLSAAEIDIDAANQAIALRVSRSEFDGVVAPLFSPEATYVVDDVVVYNEQLWVCVVEVSLPGPWTGAGNWTLRPWVAKQMRQAEIDIDANASAITAKASNTRVDGVETIANNAKVAIDAANPKISQSITSLTEIEDNADTQGEATLHALLAQNGSKQQEYTVRKRLATAEQTITAHSDALSAEAASRLVLAARVDDAEAGLVEERTVRASQMAAEAAARESLAVRVGSAEAGLTNEAQARVEADQAEAQARETLSAQINDPTTGVIAAIASEAQARATADQGEAEARQALEAQINNPLSGLAAAHAAVTSEAQARVDGDDAEAYQRGLLVAQINDPATGLAAAHSSIAAEGYARATGDQAVAETAKTLLAVAGAAQADTYSPTRPYYVGEGCVLGGMSYVCKAAVTGTAPPNQTYWTLVKQSSALIQEHDSVILGYCTIDGAVDPSVKTATECVDAGGIWTNAGIVESAKQVQVVKPDGSYAAIQQAMDVYANQTAGLNAQYTLKLDNDGFPAGFGLASESVNGVPFSEFQFHSDRFSIINAATSPQTITALTAVAGVATATASAHGLTSGDFVVTTGVAEREYNGSKQVTVVDVDHFTFPVSGTPASPASVAAGFASIKFVRAAIPFIVQDGRVYIDVAMIKDATITSAKIGSLAADKISAGVIQAAIELQAAIITGGSLNIGPLGGGVSRFSVDVNGVVNLRSALSGARMEQTSNAIKVYDENGVKRVHIGDLNA